MVDLAFGPEPGKRPDMSDPHQSYLAMARQKRTYSAALLALFFVMLATGFHLAEGRNAGGFLNGLPMLGAFPSEIMTEAWTTRANVPGLALHFVPSLIETLNIAAVSTLPGGVCAAFLALLSTRGLPPIPA